ncbi:MAG: hypothetical protein QOD09_5090 [Bradyrhizobium sp.]|jgi:hypothetical protein|nr:hypothetical protein [Bradyrhizobium sp.]MEA2950539.1 hypothetical protein [Alphaproteobacteria bacterium]
MCLHTVICCVSLVYLADGKVQVSFDPATFHIFYDPAGLYRAAIVVAAFALVSIAFCFARFSFGWVAGFYFYTMIAGYLWLNCFTDLNYDHRLSGLSAAVSAVTFLLPALFIVSSIKQRYTMSLPAFDRLLTVILLLAVAAVSVGALYNFRLVSIRNIYDFRDTLQAPVIVNYAIAMSSSALLPFAFAGFFARRAWWRAGAALLLLLIIYPITLSKLALFAPFWLLAVLLLSRMFDIKTAVILSLLAPLLIGLILHVLFNAQTALYFSIVNFRLVAIPSNSLDIYNDFFSRHDPTYFCQISILRRFMSCPYQEPLWTVMEKAYNLGNLNASLFATEGVASVGLLWAPVATFGCGLVIALGNRLSAGLPPRFILLSSAVLLPVLLNVPLSIVLNTHGAVLLFLLWYITPRAIFEKDDAAAR